MGHPAAVGGLVVDVVVPVALAFLVGSLNPASTIARILGRDLRGSGSGNPGATNAGRVLGVRWGIVVGVLDVLKGWLPAWAADRLDLGTWSVLACGLAAVLGHMWSPFLRGRGGKGVATALGAMLAIEPWFALVGVVVLALALPFVRRMGLAVVLACVALLVVGVLAATRVIAVGSGPAGLWLCVVVALVLARHQWNIRAWWRLLH